MSGNREYKSDVFSMLMQDKERALQLYNAMNGSSYDNPEDVEMVIHDGGISLSVRNDASFIVDARLSIYEHQSTVCPNMPVRSLIYFSVILSDMLSDKKKGTKSGKNIYGRRLVKIPTPHFVVFYNGEEEQPEVQELKLSDAFEQALAHQESSTGMSVDFSARNEAVEALVALGYGNAEALRAVKNIENIEEKDTETILKEALKRLI